MISPVDIETTVPAEEEIPPSVRARHTEFFRCEGCAKYYWKGSHYDRMIRIIEEIRRNRADR
jgi:uncharacterized protein with PIN domain